MTNLTLQHHFNVDYLDVLVYPDKRETSLAAAQYVAARLEQAIKNRGEANAIFATGASQYDFVAALREMKQVDWTKVTAFHLDEYLGLPADHPASFRLYLQERLFDHLPFAAIHLLQGDASDPAGECVRYGALLARRTIDVACIGIGENGHLAFNDPPADFETTDLVHLVTLDEACRQQQVGEGHFGSLEEVPGQALSLTVPAILRAQFISCVTPDTRKATAVRCALEGSISPDCPASALRTHRDCRLYLDTGSASLLSTETLSRFP